MDKFVQRRGVSTGSNSEKADANGRGAPSKCTTTSLALSCRVPQHQLAKVETTDAPPSPSSMGLGWGPDTKKFPCDSNDPARLRDYRGVWKISMDGLEAAGPLCAWTPTLKAGSALDMLRATPACCHTRRNGFQED